MALLTIGVNTCKNLRREKEYQIHSLCDVEKNHIIGTSHIGFPLVLFEPGYATFIVLLILAPRLPLSHRITFSLKLNYY